MKVIKAGREQKGWAKQIICTGSGNGDGGCRAILLVEEGDLFHTHRSDYGGDTDTFTTFKCIACGVNTDVKVPSNVRVREREKESGDDNGSAK